MHEESQKLQRNLQKKRKRNPIAKEMNELKNANKAQITKLIKQKKELIKQKKESDIEDRTFKSSNQSRTKKIIEKGRKAYLIYGIPSREKFANH